MKKIKVLYGGCGIKYKDGSGNERHALKTPESGPFECDDAQAERLVGLGVAVYVGETGQTAAKQEDTGKQTEGTGEPEKKTGHLDAEQLKELTIDKLKALAADMGVDVSKCKKKDEYIAAIVAVEVEIDDEDEGDDDLPDLSAADPE